jgi:hypothetical protein
VVRDLESGAVLFIGKRFLLLRNEESLSEDAVAELKKLRFEFKDLGTASLMKEYLRNIYRIAPAYELARTAFLLWCEKAEASGVHCLKKMAKTIQTLETFLPIPGNFGMLFPFFERALCVSGRDGQLSSI